MAPPERLGVGLIGAGLVTQTIHLPALASLADTFVVRHISDPDESLAAHVGATVGARYSTHADALIADPDVDVVAVCSPHRFHAEQVIAACEAGKRAVLCEKPLAVSLAEAERIGEASRRTGVPVVVGAMHLFDPGWLWADRRSAELRRTAHTIRSSIVLPPNSRYEELATEVYGRHAAGPGLDMADPAAQAQVVVGGVLGLAVHDLPLIRTFLPQIDDLVVHEARPLLPWGYRIVFTAGGRTVELHAVVDATWQPDWTLEVVSDTEALRLDFTPSYVQAGSARAALRSRDSTTVAEPADSNGYSGEWQHVATLARGEVVDGVRHEHDLADLHLVLRLADAASELIAPDSREAA
ncbi:Inositol 2-dehydrogenase/D-chiro-inositol 3-dehydrogenase [Streptomyces tendae]